MMNYCSNNLLYYAWIVKKHYRRHAAASAKTVHRMVMNEVAAGGHGSASLDR